MPSSKRQLRAQVSLDMHEEDSQKLLDFLRCCACNELAEDALETNCCSQLLCSACLGARQLICPKCQSACTLAPSHLARRLVGYQPWQCPSCGKDTTRSERADHNAICPKQVRKCPANDCNFKGFAAAYVVHLTEKHGEQLLKNIECLFPNSANATDSSSDDEESIASSSDSSDIRFRRRRMGFQPSWLQSSDSDRFDASRIEVSETGKNYCEGPLNGPPCRCCDGRCGPGNGCNCVDCMRRDLVSFEITTPRTLVNREGVVSKISSETGKFYCGRRSMRHDPTTDGYCGPNNGNNCHACRTLDYQIHNRYRAIAAEWDEVEGPSIGIAEARDSLELAMGYDTVDFGIPPPVDDDNWITGSS